MADTAKRLYLLDGMALVYRAHFAFINRPIRTSAGLNSSSLFGYANTVLELIREGKPTHLGVAFDTEAPTERHQLFPEYKAQREAMPEDLSLALPHLRRLTEAFNIPVILRDGFEADDIIGTLARKAEAEGFTTFMVTPDKDFGQLVDENTFLYRPARMGDGAEVLGVSEICSKWGIEAVAQVIDLLALQGDASDNIPGVPGIGPKTAQKLIANYGSVENLLQHVAELKGKQRGRIEEHADQALLCKKLATINCEVPLAVQPADLRWERFDEEALKAFFVEFEFNTLGRRVFGDSFKAGRGFKSQGKVEKSNPGDAKAAPELPLTADLKKLGDVPHDYTPVRDARERAEFLRQLMAQSSVCFDLETTSLEPRLAEIVGIAFCWETGRGHYVVFPQGPDAVRDLLEFLRPFFENPAIEKVGHNLKYDLGVLRWHGLRVRGRFVDTMLAHSLAEPELRHGMDFLAESLLGYSPIPIRELIGDGTAGKPLSMREVPVEKVVEYAVEDADVTWQLRPILERAVHEKGQRRVFDEIEAPLLPVLVEMEREGIRLDPGALEDISAHLVESISRYERDIYGLAGREFNLNSPKQLGEILFDVLKLADKPRKTRTGQYSTNEQTLIGLASKHEIVQRILEYREYTKLKSTYVDMLPGAVFERTGRIHTTYNQAVTSTGRLQSQNPNLQNIPIRTQLGREIRKAFVARDAEHVLLSADYSQIELRIIASLSGDTGMLEAFQAAKDIHAATAARVYDVPFDSVLPEMRRTAKMVNFGIIYGISAFGLSQRLGIPRSDAGAIIDQYFRQYPGIQAYMNETISFARDHGYVETVTGRRRYLPDIGSANATVRGAAERNAINMPIQGTAADMIKIAMVRIDDELSRRRLRTKMLLQVHDELVFDMAIDEETVVRPMVDQLMREAIPMKAPIVVETGVGRSWLEAH